jgi:hypothetical protein
MVNRKSTVEQNGGFLATVKKRDVFLERKRTAAHQVGERRLPARQIYPVGEIPPMWARPIADAIRLALRSWGDEAAGG